ncbi:MAG: phosphate/phosphite/phosphonate ABC transporter substrate-binding protein [Rhodocyclaceae bacterium]|nr:phosphate/phosphite/phosphonate ABC transporter substrate-binding protein [Rhodocyclaceae bacterium]MDZ4214507.1 phosphate/phosphite/phosphonate ABC transporter substrate-binding protein [Rhodocyclaceae bacterium]
MSRRLFLRASLCAGLALARPLARAQDTPLRMGIHPYNSTLALIGTHRPLVQYLEKIVARPIEFITAPNFDAYLSALLAGEYDLVIAPPHFAAMAMQREYVALYQYKSRLEPLLTVRTASALQTARDFRGKKIAMADPTALIRLATVKWLEANHLQAGRDYQLVNAPTHGAAVAATVQGEVDAGLTTLSGLAQIPADLRQQVRAIRTGIQLPHLVTLAHRRVGETDITRLRAALMALPATAEGKDFFTRLPVQGYEPFTVDDVRAMQPYVDLLMKK